MPRRPSPPNDDPIVQLNRWQLTGALLGLGLIVAVVFFVGVIVGRQSTAPLPPALARIASAASGEHAKTPERRGGLEAVTPGTRLIDEDLSRPPGKIIPRDPKEAARIAAHEQLQRSRTGGIAGLNGPEGDGGDHPVAAAPVPVQPASARGESAYTLQVSAFETAGPADAIAAELRAAGHPVVVRRIADSGRAYWRVEVGRFETSEEATRYQRRFDQQWGQPTVLVPTP